MAIIFLKFAEFWLKNFLDIKDGPSPMSGELSWLDGCHMTIMDVRSSFLYLCHYSCKTRGAKIFCKGST